MIKNNFSKRMSKFNNSKAQGLPLNTIVIAILVVVVMVVMIVMFNGGTDDAKKDLNGMSDSFSGCSNGNTIYSKYDNVAEMTKAECRGISDGSVLMAATEDKDKICCGYMNDKAAEEFGDEE